MSSKRSHHGNTPAAWTAVIIAIVAFLVGGFGTIIGNLLIVGLGFFLLALSAVVGKLMQMAGLGQFPNSDA
ncbi:MAG: hypothetical protein RIS09_290 [Actinomycetota bacterium]|jgi:hypothetical protein